MSVCSCFILIKLHRKCNGRKTLVFAELSALDRKVCFQLPWLRAEIALIRQSTLQSQPGRGARWVACGGCTQESGPRQKVRSWELWLPASHLQGLRSDFVRLIRIVIALKKKINIYVGDICLYFSSQKNVPVQKKTPFSLHYSNNRWQYEFSPRINLFLKMRIKCPQVYDLLRKVHDSTKYFTPVLHFCIYFVK